MDVLDIDPRRTDRWVMCYADGRIRRSQYRHDLVLRAERVSLTRAAWDEWPEWEGAVEGRVPTKNEQIAHVRSARYENADKGPRG